MYPLTIGWRLRIATFGTRRKPAWPIAVPRDVEHQDTAI